MASTGWANVYGIKSLGKCVHERSMVSRVWAHVFLTQRGLWYQEFGQMVAGWAGSSKSSKVVESELSAHECAN